MAAELLQQAVANTAAPERHTVTETWFLPFTAPDGKFSEGPNKVTNPFAESGLSKPRVACQGQQTRLDDSDRFMYGPQIGEKLRRDHYLRSRLVCGSKPGQMTETDVMIGDLVSLDKCHPELGGRFIVWDITAVRSVGTTG